MVNTGRNSGRKVRNTSKNSLFLCHYAQKGDEMAGRKSKLTLEVILGLERAIAAGMPYELACRQVGIGYRTFNDWVNGRFPQSAPVELRTLFSQTIKKAKAEAAYEALQVIMAATRGELPNGANWTAAAWFLERRHPDHFRRRSK
jgi:hypothetical protein